MHVKERATLIMGSIALQDVVLLKSFMYGQYIQMTTFNTRMRNIYVVTRHVVDYRWLSRKTGTCKNLTTFFWQLFDYLPLNARSASFQISYVNKSCFNTSLQPVNILNRRGKLHIFFSWYKSYSLRTYCIIYPLFTQTMFRDSFQRVIVREGSTMNMFWNSHILSGKYWFAFGVWDALNSSAGFCNTYKCVKPS